MCDRSLWYLDEYALNDNIKKTLVKFCGPTPIVYSDVNSLYQSSTEPPAAAEYSSLLRPLRYRALVNRNNDKLSYMDLKFRFLWGRWPANSVKVMHRFYRNRTVGGMHS